MDQRIKEWWTESAKGIIETCLIHVKKRQEVLEEYAKDINRCLNEDKTLIDEFNKDIKSIREHIKDVKKPYLKHRENFFVVCIKDHLFDFALKIASINSLGDVTDKINIEYIKAENLLMNIKTRIENNDPNIDLSIIDQATEAVCLVQKLDQDCSQMAQLRLDLEKERDDILDKMENFIDDGSRRLSLAEQQAGLI